jgi:hypothetical protein
VNLDASFQRQRGTGRPGQPPNVCCSGCRGLLTLKTPPSLPLRWTKARGGYSPHRPCRRLGRGVQQEPAEDWWRPAYERLGVASKEESGSAGASEPRKVIARWSCTMAGVPAPVVFSWSAGRDSALGCVIGGETRGSERYRRDAKGQFRRHTAVAAPGPRTAPIGLENRWRGDPSVGSNPTPPAPQRSRLLRQRRRWTLGGLPTTTGSSGLTCLTPARCGAFPRSGPPFGPAGRGTAAR